LKGGSRPWRLALILVVTIATASCQRPGTSREGASDPPAGEWRTYGGTYASARYSPLDQIDRTNVGQLRVAWRWRSPDHDVMAQNPRVETFANQATPLMVGGVLYVSTSLSQVAAIDAATGQTLWVHDPEVWRLGTTCRVWARSGVGSRSSPGRCCSRLRRGGWSTCGGRRNVRG
jgi:quinoprotein glucose dehydrogenase